ncbi:hypothetical protein NQZ68_033454 [Dissostichus eleginoides]|nr:hypothetical protein NQZ68_033454 [Dissostichus eleginoides]
MLPGSYSSSASGRGCTPHAAATEWRVGWMTPDDEGPSGHPTDTSAPPPPPPSTHPHNLPNSAPLTDTSPGRPAAGGFRAQRAGRTSPHSLPPHLGERREGGVIMLQLRSVKSKQEEKGDLRHSGSALQGAEVFAREQMVVAVWKTAGHRGNGTARTPSILWPRLGENKLNPDAGLFFFPATNTASLFCGASRGGPGGAMATLIYLLAPPTGPPTTHCLASHA